MGQNKKVIGATCTTYRTLQRIKTTGDVNPRKGNIVRQAEIVIETVRTGISTGKDGDRYHGDAYSITGIGLNQHLGFAPERG